MSCFHFSCVIFFGQYSKIIKRFETWKDINFILTCALKLQNWFFRYRINIVDFMVLFHSFARMNKWIRVFFLLVDEENDRKLSIRGNYYAVQRSERLKWLLSWNTDQSKLRMPETNSTQLLVFQILLYFSTGQEWLKLFTESFRQHDFERAKRLPCNRIFWKSAREKKNIAVKIASNVIFSR